jgi:membrane associated rhomboid family serine protease
MDGPYGICNLLIILVTGVVSVVAFSNRALEQKLIFHPESILAEKQYYRIVTCGFLHADWQHLGLNMLSLYFFGNGLERWLGPAQFLAIYFGAIVGGSLLSLYVHRHHDYLAYGASGGVCGVIFAHILLFPGTGIFLFFIPVPIPGWLYAIGFLLGSFWALKAGRDNIGHDAHLGGAIVGLLITAGLQPAARENWKLLLLLLGISSALLAYLWMRPSYLPTPSLPRLWFRRKNASDLPRYRQEPRRVDEILDKISQHGIHSLTEDERALLDEVSGKYRRRAESKKPESDLII